MTVDRVTVNEPGDWRGPDSLLGAIDEVVVHDVNMIHLEAMSNRSAFLAIYKADGTELRFWLEAWNNPTGTVLDMREEQ